jgi:hypothetical protein
MCTINGNIFPHYSDDTTKQETAILSEVTKNKILLTNEDKIKRSTNFQQTFKHLLMNLLVKEL